MIPNFVFTAGNKSSPSETIKALESKTYKIPFAFATSLIASWADLIIGSKAVFSLVCKSCCAICCNWTILDCSACTSLILASFWAWVWAPSSEVYLSILLEIYRFIKTDYLSF